MTGASILLFFLFSLIENICFTGMAENPNRRAPKQNAQG
jgi:hypothetical protein